MESYDMYDFVLNYGHKITDELQVKISENLNSFVFADKYEKVIIEKIVNSSKEEFINLRSLPMLQDKTVKFIADDPECTNGFYFICCKEYGHIIQVEHSHRQDKILKFNTDVEPGVI